MLRASELATTTPFRYQTAPWFGTGERFGDYQLHELLGEGGMAVVHRAEIAGVAGFRKEVALKRMRPELTSDPELIAAFVHEAQLASRVRHPNVAQAYDLGKIAGTYYIAMELVPGPTLATLLVRSRRLAIPVPVPLAVAILIELCDALEAVHNLTGDDGRPLGVIHRDISPGNVIISHTGAVKLIDFGIAKARSARHATEAGVIKGKHAYVAPEYTYGRLDQRVDLFSLGVLAHELLSGERLFLGYDEMSTIRNVREMTIDPPSLTNPAVDRELDAIVMTALSRDPEQRWQNAAAIRNALSVLAHSYGPAVTNRQVRDWVDWLLAKDVASAARFEATERIGRARRARRLRRPAERTIGKAIAARRVMPLHRIGIWCLTAAAIIAAFAWVQ